MAGSDSSRLAVLIDADNASAAVAKELLEEVAKYGRATVKRAYGDWTTQSLVGWKNRVVEKRNPSNSPIGFSTCGAVLLGLCAYLHGVNRV